LILVDANLLVYAHAASFPQHEVARQWLDRQLNGFARVGLPWPSLLAFLRLVTNPRIFEYAEPVEQAWAQVSSWLACDLVWVPEPTEQHALLLETLLAIPGVYGNLVPDAHLAALAIEHGLTLCSADADFARFPNLNWTNPLAG
jgi:uncharacterized protein